MHKAVTIVKISRSKGYVEGHLHSQDLRPKVCANCAGKHVPLHSSCGRAAGVTLVPEAVHALVTIEIQSPCCDIKGEPCGRPVP